MSTISKELAGRIAYKLTEKSRIFAENLHVDYRELVTSLYEDQTPEEVIACHKKHQEWFYTRGCIEFNGNGFRYTSVSSTRQIICNGATNANLHLTSKIADKISVAQRKWEKAKAKYEELKRETEQALLTLRTFKNIRTELPEAAPFLPPPMSNALVVNFTSLKKSLTHQPDVPEKTVEIIEED